MAVREPQPSEAQTRAEAKAQPQAQPQPQPQPEPQPQAQAQPRAETQSDPRPDLTPTGRVILGMIAFGKSSGYDIKQFVDKSTRHFWAASYGQIYPELKRLEDQGLVVGHPEPTGGRARMVYELTGAGRTALLEWLDSGEEPLYELRDEGMLKLFFSDASSPERRIEVIRAMRTRQERKLAQLQAIEGHAKEGPPGPYLTLQLGLGSTQWFIDWCEATERRLAAEIGKE